MAMALQGRLEEIPRMGTPNVDPPEEQAAMVPYENPQHQDSVQDIARPKNEQVWAASTKTRLGKARSLRQAAEQEIAKTTVSAFEGKKNHTAVGNRMQSHLRKKIDTTHSIARSLWDRTSGTEETIRHVGHSIFQLTRAQQATVNPLEVVSKCVELRKSRPMQELVNDHFQKSLEEEQAVLQYAQKQYVERMEISRGILQELEQAKTLLHEDMVRKRHASRLDKAVLRGPDGVGAGKMNEEPQKDPASPSSDYADGSFHGNGSLRGEVPLPRLRETSNENGGRTPQNGTPRPQSAGQPYQVKASQQSTLQRQIGAEVTMTDTQSNKWQESALQLMASTHELCLTASRVCAKNEEVLRERQKDCEASRKLVLENMRKRLLETSELRRSLEQEIRETDRAVTNIEEGLSETERQCDLHNVPLQQIQKTTEIRKQRIDGEKIRDIVTIAKEDVLSTLNANIRVLQEQYKRKKTVLIQMQTMRSQLQEDLRFKIQALSIDNQCSKLLTRPHSARLGTTSPQAPPIQQGIQKPHFRRKAQREQAYAQTWGPGSQGW